MVQDVATDGLLILGAGAIVMKWLSIGATPAMVAEETKKCVRQNQSAEDGVKILK